MMKGQKSYVQVASPAPDSQVCKVLAAFKQLMGRWYELHRQRRTLAGMSDSALKDMGLSRVDVLQEYERPFWDDPMKR
ncbi:DUF1127 domain-containing protein [Pseudomonas sp. CDFA 602]|nr:DUF1127 domain-containing protein [Pseudomonas californiensis]MCD5997089.1 DUF1127 domain-containing protein [Pseudomonas californiensis]MCD6002691.1 DUF1127 domain-containing protein [Pseudomonas californiensis]